jgi:hypothetical protein
MMASRYLIPDEPRPSGLAHLAVNPLWPLLAQMLGGSWLALPWFLVNGAALGSPSQRREWLCAAASLFGSLLLVFGIAAGSDAGWLGGIALKLAMLSIVALKIAMAYALYMMQSRSYELWEYFGGKARNGLLVIVAAYVLRTTIFTALESSPLIALALG